MNKFTVSHSEKKEGTWEVGGRQWEWCWIPSTNINATSKNKTELIIGSIYIFSFCLSTPNIHLPKWQIE